jgi:hypothetical protein
MTVEVRNPQKETLVINLYGGPGTGKSTTAAALFVLLKRKNINCELVFEYAKDVVWEGRDYLLRDQIYVFSKQNRRLDRLYGKVDIIITDAPLLLSYYYSKNEAMLPLIQTEMARAKQMHIMLKRVKVYNSAGRYQTELQAIEIDVEIKGMLDRLKIDYLNVTADNEAERVISTIIDSL